MNDEAISIAVDILSETPRIETVQDGAKLIISVYTHKSAILTLPALQEEAIRQGKEIPLEIYLGLQPNQIRRHQDMMGFRKACSDNRISHGDITGLDILDKGLIKDGEHFVTMFTVNMSHSHLTSEECGIRDFLSEVFGV